MSQPTMTVCACSDPWCRTNGCRIGNAQRYGQQINYGPAYVVPNLHAECAKREDELRREVADLQMLRDEHMLDNQHAHDEGSAQGIKEERAAVVAWLRGRPGYGPVADSIERGEHRRKEEP